MREDNIIDYYTGTQAYLAFLVGVTHDNYECRKCILNCGDESINAAKMGFISNMFLMAKEGIIEKKGNIFNALILEKELEKNVNLIARKQNDGYVIDNYLFKNKEILIAELRNKIAHGNFRFDLGHNKIILNVNDNDVRINIDKLSNFVTSSATSYFKNFKTNSYTRKITFSKKIDTQRNKIINNKNELINFIKKYKRLTINIKSKDESIIPKFVLDDFEFLLSFFRKDADEKLLYENIKIFEKHYNNQYLITFDKEPFKNIDYSSFADYIINSLRNNVTFIDQAKIIGAELERYECIADSKLNIMLDNLHNIMILNVIKKNNTVSVPNIGKEIQARFGRTIMISAYTVASSLITSFNALFSYGKDNIYKNRNKYSEVDTDGLDYSKLDLSLLNIELCNIDTGHIDDLEKRKDAKYKDLEKIDNNIIKLKDNILKTKNNEVMLKLKNLLKQAETAKIEINEEYKKTLEEYNNAINYYKDNIDYLKNERIIEGIRNSIAHGNYYIKHGSSMNDSIIVFEDIYEGNLNFKCSVKINDFMEFLDKSCNVISDFIDNNKTKTLTK